MTGPLQDPASEDRFAFGENWQRFLEKLTPQRVAEAERSLREMLNMESLRGLSFLDVGSGSGLFSLAARLLEARVRSFDYDLQSVACTQTLKDRFFPGDGDWVVEPGDALDQGYWRSLGRFDVVYSWGVLHHTGDQWRALDNAAQAVDLDGLLCLALYNDQGWPSRLWAGVKLAYNRLPGPLRWLVAGPALLRLWGPATLRDCLRGRPLHTWRSYESNRGMNAWCDFLDWVGGYPFEVSRPHEVEKFLANRGFTPLKRIDCGRGLGCNEFLLRRQATA